MDDDRKSLAIVLPERPLPEVKIVEPFDLLYPQDFLRSVHVYEEPMKTAALLHWFVYHGHDYSTVGVQMSASWTGMFGAWVSHYRTDVMTCSWTLERYFSQSEMHRP